MAAPSPEGRYKIGTIARRSGFTPAALRAWELRHHLLEPERRESGHRLYTEDDLALLVRVRELIDGGQSIGEVVRLGRERLIAEGRRRLEEGRDTPPGRVETALHPSAKSDSERVDASTQLGSLARDAARAAISLDERSLRGALDLAFSLVPAEWVIRDVIEAAARELGDLWARGRASVASEHLASNVFSSRLRELVAARQRLIAENAPRAISGCLPGEHHELGALVVAYHASRWGYRVAFLGADLPIESLEHAILELDATCVFLSATGRETFQSAERDLCDLAERHRTRVRFVLGGQAIRFEEPELRAHGIEPWPPGRGFPEQLELPTAVSEAGKEHVRLRRDEDTATGRNPSRKLGRRSRAEAARSGKTEQKKQKKKKKKKKKKSPKKGQKNTRKSPPRKRRER